MFCDLHTLSISGNFYCCLEEEQVLDSIQVYDIDALIKQESKQKYFIFMNMYCRFSCNPMVPGSKLTRVLFFCGGNVENEPV